mmetsp:Transcript_4355/g.8176  ORF Transcript_4355/g.8176 Transcript_4355/m.8176 type:complete len:206 (-) Transcript_4355:2443-3060(-)
MIVLQLGVLVSSALMPHPILPMLTTMALSTWTLTFFALSMSCKVTRLLDANSLPLAMDTSLPNLVMRSTFSCHLSAAAPAPLPMPTATASCRVLMISVGLPSISSSPKSSSSASSSSSAEKVCCCCCAAVVEVTALGVSLPIPAMAVGETFSSLKKLSQSSSLKKATPFLLMSSPRRRYPTPLLLNCGAMLLLASFSGNHSPPSL